MIRANHANFGGGVSVFNGSQARVNATVVSGNSATQNGGGGLANGVPAAAGGTSTPTAGVSRNNTSAGTDPGGIRNNGGTVPLRVSVVSGNTPSNCLNSPAPAPGCFG